MKRSSNKAKAEVDKPFTTWENAPPATETLLSICNIIAIVRNKTDLLGIITGPLKSLFNYHSAAVITLDKQKKNYSFYVLDIEKSLITQANNLFNATNQYPVADNITGVLLQVKTPVIFNSDALVKQPDCPHWVTILHQTGMKEIAGIALRDVEEELGAIFLFSEKLNFLSFNSLNLLPGIACQFSNALAYIIANEKIAQQLEEINSYKKHLEEGMYLQAETKGTFQYSEIIGTGAEMQRVFHLLTQVSFTASTVLILGETGTGKELIARAIHHASSRKDKLMVKVNCAALPPSLIESELFGHERGSFTGAIDRRIGKFEIANHSTLFLDEIGELPLDLQVKLLRALQEKEIERIGGKHPIKTNVRIIAATNRDLVKEVETGKFRSDLYYRLNVFPIVMPPLRNRPEDIPALTSFFMARYARNTGKSITTISHKALQKLLAYSWPGNVRELEHLIERSVLLATSATIKEVHLPVKNRKSLASNPEGVVKTLAENERDHILAVLKKCKGRVSGPGGAAELLGVPYSTLNSKIKKLGIKKAHFLIE